MQGNSSVLSECLLGCWQVLRLQELMLVGERARRWCSLSVQRGRRWKRLQQWQHELALVIGEDDLDSQLMSISKAIISSTAATYLSASKWNTRMSDLWIHILRKRDVLLSLDKSNTGQ